jgi:DNA-binding LacI/PurR family transcriptional regulator
MSRVRIQEVAEVANVSVGTVSAVLNGKEVVRAATRQRILDVIERLGYRPDVYARNLARRQTRVLGLIVSDLVNPFFAETAQAFEREAHQRGYQVSLAATNFSSSQLRTCVEQMLGLRLAGLAVMTSEFDTEASKLIAESDTPTVFLDVGKVSGRMSNICVDTKNGMAMAVRHLVGLGHRDILLLRNSVDSESYPSMLSHRNRSAGFKSAIEEYRRKGVRARSFDIPGPGASAGLRAIQAALEEEKFTAVVAISDLVALGAYRGLIEAGLRIPQDVSVVGFDNTYLSEFMNPALTTIDIPKSELSKTTVELLISAVEDERPGVELTLPTTLVVRGSTAPPPGTPSTKRAKHPIAKSKATPSSKRR